MRLVYFSIFVASLTLVLTAPAPNNFNQPTVVKYENENDGTGNYRFSFETSDGTKREETGTLINPGQPDEHIAVVGSYSYLRPDGTYENINYSADENGYKILNGPVEPNKEIPIYQIPMVVQALPNTVVASLLG